MASKAQEAKLVHHAVTSLSEPIALAGERNDFVVVHFTIKITDFLY